MEFYYTKIGVVWMLCQIAMCIYGWRVDKKEKEMGLKNSLPKDETIFEFYKMFFEQIAKQSKMKLDGLNRRGDLILWEKPWELNWKHGVVLHGAKNFSHTPTAIYIEEETENGHTKVL